MRKHLSLSVTMLIAMLLLTGFLPALAQQMPKQLPISAPKIVNFKQLADYQLAHPKKIKSRFVEQGEDRDKDFKYKGEPTGSNAVNFNVSLPKIQTRSVSPSPSVVFNGPIDNTGIVPPDVQAAAGDNYVMATTNQEFDIYSKTGQLISTVAPGYFFSAIQVDVEFSDPHVVYDSRYNRFIVCIDPIDLRNYNDDGGWGIAVSETSDPTGNWYVYTYDAGIRDWEGGGALLDYPLLGFNKNWVVITGNFFTTTDSIICQMDVFDRAKLYNGTLGTVSSFSDPNVYTYAPALTFDTSEATEYLVTDNNGNNNGMGYMQVGTITGPVTAPVYTADAPIGVNSTWGESEVDANQPDGATPITTNGTGVGNAVYRNGALWFTHTVFLPTGGPTYSGVDWWEINPSKPSVLQYGRISDPSGLTFYFFPSVCVDSAGDAVVGYTSSSPSEYASAEYSFRASTDPKNSMEQGYIYNAGLSTYDNSGSGRNRWGDFSYTFMDPVNGSFWTDQEYAYTPANTWATTLANISGTPCNGGPAAGAISATSDTLCNGNGITLNLTGYTSNVIGIRIVWQQSLTGINGWTNATGGYGDSTDTYSTAPLTVQTYFRCVVSCANSGLSDTSSPFKVIVPGINSVADNVPDSICMPGNYTFTTTAIGTPEWYASGTSNTPVAKGDTLKAYIIQDTTFYVSTGKSILDSVGIPNDNNDGGYFNYTYTDGLLFNAISDFTLDSLYIYSSSVGDVTVDLIDADNNTTVASNSIAVKPSQVGFAVVVPTNFSCAAGTDYNITGTGTNVSGLYRTSDGANFPYTVPNVVSINGPNNGAAGHYYFFYDWHISSGCESARIPITVNYASFPMLLSASSDTLCSNKDDSVLLTVSGGTSYQWSPGNSTDSSFYVKPTSTTTYTVTGTNSGGCITTKSVIINVKDCTAGINTVAANTPNIDVYPNPTTGEFDLIMTNLPNNTYTVSVYNLLSQKIMEKQVDVNSSSYMLPMDVSALPSGVYFIQAVNGTQEWTNRVIKR